MVESFKTGSDSDNQQ